MDLNKNFFNCVLKISSEGLKYIEVVELICGLVMKTSEDDEENLSLIV